MKLGIPETFAVAQVGHIKKKKKKSGLEFQLWLSRNESDSYP